MYDREEDEDFKTTASNGTWDKHIPPLTRKLLDLYHPAESTVVQKKEEGVQTTVTEEPVVEINLREYSHAPNCMKLTRVPSEVDFLAVPEKKRRMKVKRFEW